MLRVGPVVLNQQSEFSNHQLQEKADLMIRAGLLGRRAAVILMIMAAAATVTTAGQRSSKQPYFPARGEWQKKDPSAVGLDKAKLHEAIAFAVAHENPNTKDLSVAIVNQFRSRPPSTP